MAVQRERGDLAILRERRDMAIIRERGHGSAEGKGEWLY